MIVHITATIGDGLVARWTFDPRTSRSDGEISASRSGVCFAQMPRISTEADRREVMSAFTCAWECYRMLAQREERSFMFERLTKAEVAAWLRERGERVVDVHFCESVAEALAREAAQ